MLFSCREGIRPILVAAVLAVGIPPLATAQEKLTDTKISNAVSDELMEDSAVPGDRIDVEVTDGVVSLEGAVRNLLPKERAEKLAGMIRGVRAVVNEIEVEAPLLTDTEIEENVVFSLGTDPATEAWEVEVEVFDGTVTLDGMVDSWQEKQLAAKVAKSVRGVKGVENEIAVDYETDRANKEIRKEIEAALRWDAYIDDALIDVAVKDGKVTLSGVVGSLAEKERAFNKCWVAGVTRVDYSDVEVRWWAREDKLREKKYVSRPEEEVRNAVLDAFLYDPRVRSFDIDVEIDAGTATLRGTVDNLRARRAAADDARNVVGVWSVNNKIKVRYEGLSDKTVERSVEQALENDSYLNRFDIIVSVEDGEAYLYGEVDSSFEKAHADTVASRQMGVTQVHNRLDVAGRYSTVYGPYTGESSMRNYEWVEQPASFGAKSDWEIRRDIESELRWSPFIDRADVTIVVDDGVATLTGTVDTWSESQTARQEALEAGAVRVENELKVEFGPDYYSTE